MVRESPERSVTATGLGVLFSVSGLSELLLLPQAVRMFEAFQLPPWSLLAVGAIEVCAGSED
jgi:uncharacterized membrane protein YphA (DoxX/SURF4 family)